MQHTDYMSILYFAAYLNIVVIIVDILYLIDSIRTMNKKWTLFLLLRILIGMAITVSILLYPIINES